MQKYKEVPWYWYGALLLLAFLAGQYLLPAHFCRVSSTIPSGLIVCIKGETTLPVWSYFIAILLGSKLLPLR